MRLLQLFCIFALCLALVACCPQQEDKNEYQQQSSGVADKGICGDKVCSGSEGEPLSSKYCKQDCTQ